MEVDDVSEGREQVVGRTKAVQATVRDQETTRISVSVAGVVEELTQETEKEYREVEAVPGTEPRVHSSRKYSQ